MVSSPLVLVNPLSPRDLARFTAALKQEPACAGGLLSDLIFCRALEELGALPAPRADLTPALVELDLYAQRHLGVCVFSAPPPLVSGAISSVLHALRARSVITATFDVFGHLHERLQARGHKDAGLYYTRPELVRAMAESTVGRLATLAVDQALALSRRGDPAEARRIVTTRLLGLRVLDPACGAGPFLIAAAAILWREVQRFAAADKTPIPDAARHIAHNLRGVDLDPAAILAARRNTWLWLLRAGAAPPLPALEEALRCADALRDPPPPGSADVVLGNPPYIGEEGHKDLFRAAARTPLGRYYEGKMDYACFFVHLGLDALAEGGLLCFVLPSYLQTAAGARLLNRRLCRESTIEEVRDFGTFPVFSATAPGQHSMILRLRKTPAPESRPLVARLLPTHEGPAGDVWAWGEAAGPFTSYAAPPQRELLDEHGALCLSPRGAAALCELMSRSGPPLRTLAFIDTGLQAGPGTLSTRAAAVLAQDGTPPPRPGAGVFVLSTAERQALQLSPDEARLLRPFHPARQVRRYAADPHVGHEVLYLTSRTCPDLGPYPNVERHLSRFRPLLQLRRETQLRMRAYFHLHWPRDEVIFLGPKILCPRQTRRPAFALSEEPYFVDLALNIIRPRAQGLDLFALLALLNSAPAHFWFYHRGKRKGELLQIDGTPLGALPIPALAADEEAALSALGRRLGALHVQVQGEGAARLIRDAEDEVDALAARRYGLGGVSPSLLREPWALSRFA